MHIYFFIFYHCLHVVISDSILEPKDHPALYQSKAKKFYVLDHSQRVSLYINEGESEFDQLHLPVSKQTHTCMPWLTTWPGK